MVQNAPGITAVINSLIVFIYTYLYTSENPCEMVKSMCLVTMQTDGSRQKDDTGPRSY